MIAGKIVLCLSSIDLSIIEANWIVFMGSKLSLFDNKIMIQSLLEGKITPIFEILKKGKLKLYGTEWNSLLLLM